MKRLLLYGKNGIILHRRDKEVLTMITINVKSALIYLLFIALIILVIYLTLLAKNLIKKIKETNKILADTSVISGIAADKATQVDAIVDDVQSAVSDLSQAVKGQQNFVGALSNIVKAIGSLVAIFKKDADDGETAQKRKK